MTEKRTSGPRTGKNGDAGTGDDGEVRLALVQMIPQLLWFALALIVFAVLAGPIARAVDDGQGIELSAASVTIKVVEQRLDDARDARRQRLRRGGARPNGNKGAVVISDKVSDRIERSQRQMSAATILWIDGSHDVHTIHERRALGGLGIAVDPVRTTEEAVALLERGFAYDAIISDFVRTDPAARCMRGSPFVNAGCAGVQRIRQVCGATIPPVIMYVDGFEPEAGTPPFVIGAADEVNELIMLLLDAFERRPEAKDEESFVRQEEVSGQGRRGCARSALPGRT